MKIPTEENLSCDEQIISFNGRMSLKSNNPKESQKLEYKMWVLSDVPGFSISKSVSGEPNLRATRNVIIRMGRIVYKNINHKIFYNN